MKHILVIDDDQMTLDLLSAYLVKEDFTVTAVTDGDAGILKAKEDSIDLAIVDMVMPGRDGLQTILELHKIEPDLPIIAISGGGVVPKERYLSVASCVNSVETLSKPFLKSDLLSVINKILD